ncbi:hypothetical protein [Paenibacillus campinasensis]|uniref:Uncharacterized protein n=1 Tax=Paenibacillus campinasensis TaxID=66347 RepID=A0A268EI57_9BACL|nr:hypothetical protein [Paenibacillus campinasensis]PAD72818.1 hypothetical protein CHH67_21150 [Paenibacillus campinasensis]
MMTNIVIELIEEQIGRKMTEIEIAEISRLNDEGWPASVLAPNMQVILSLIESAREFGEKSSSK